MVRRRSTVRFRKGARRCSPAAVAGGFRRECIARPAVRGWASGTPGVVVAFSPGGVAQLVEQAAHNRCVAGSSPATATQCHARGFRGLRRELVSLRKKKKEAAKLSGMELRSGGRT